MASGDIDMMDSQDESKYNNGQNGSGDFDDDDQDDGVTQLFIAAIEHIMELEKRKAVVDEEESKVKQQLKEKHEEEKAAIQESGELLAQKESLRDKLISLKESREKLIDELNLFKSIDEEMKGFNKVNERFNESLKAHLAMIEEKQSKIYTLKPVITGVHVETECSFSRNERNLLASGIIAAITAAMTKVDEEIVTVCNGNQIHKVEEWSKLIADEKAVLQRIKSLKMRIKDKQKEKARKEAKAARAAAGGDDDNEDGDEDSSRSAKGSKRGASKGPVDMTCDGCNASYTDHEKFAYHCFRGCSRLEDLLRDLGKDVTVDCPECGDQLTSFIGYTDHMKELHGSGAKSSTPGRGSATKAGGKRRRY